MLEDATYGKQTLRIEAGDTLLLYTDGLTDARVPGAGERFGAEELLAFANRLAPATTASAVEAVTALLASFDGGLDDEAAVIAIGAPADSAGR